MTFEWPLTERELLIAGRSRRTYVRRFMIVILLSIPFAYGWLLSQYFDGAMDIGGGTRLARIVGGIGTFVQFYAAYVFTTNTASSAIIDERDGRTLELLALADPRGWDIALSKWAGVFAQSVFLMLTILPVLALSAMMGGVDVGAMALQTWYFVCIAASASALGVCASSFVRSASNANSLTSVVLVAWILFGALIDGMVGTVMGGFFNGFGVWVGLSQVFSNLPPWIALPTYSGITCVACIAIASLRVRHYVADAPPPDDPKLPAPRRAPLDKEQYERPIASLVARGDGGEGLKPTENLSFLLVLLIGFFVPVFGWILLVAMMSRSTTRALSVMIRDGTWEELMLLRVDDRSFAKEMLYGLRRRVGATAAGMFVNLFVTFFFVAMGGSIPWMLVLIALGMYGWAIVPYAARAALQAKGTRRLESIVTMTWGGWLLTGLIGFPMVGAFVYGVVGASNWGFEVYPYAFGGGNILWAWLCSRWGIWRLGHQLGTNPGASQVANA